MKVEVDYLDSGTYGAFVHGELFGTNEPGESLSRFIDRVGQVTKEVWPNMMRYLRLSDGVLIVNGCERALIDYAIWDGRCYK